MTELVIDASSKYSEPHLNITDTTLEAIAKATGRSLVGINLSGTSMVTDTGVQKIASHCPNLRILLVGDCFKVTDAAIAAAARLLPNLEVLDTACSDVAEQVLEACPCLVELNRPVKSFRRMKSDLSSSK